MAVGETVSPQEPVSNLCLRNTCESYLREKNNKKEKDEEHECPIHGEKIEMFCQTDERTICVTCMDYEHRWHKTQPLEQAARQRKGKLKTAIRPAETMLLSLRNGSAQDAKICKQNQSQAQRTERKIREEFNKLQQFLKTEEESRIAALNEEEKEKRGKMKKKIRSLSERLREVEERMKDDDVTFLQNYNSIMNRAKKTLPDSELSPEALIDVQKHLGNLKYQVWEKMKDICPYYPVILNPNASPPDVSISNDLTSVTSCVHRQDEHNPLPLHSNHLVLGSVGYSSGVQMWDIEVGNSRNWSLGVCLGTEERSFVQMLNPADGFWGLRRDGDVYRFLNISATFKLKMNPQVVRVKLGDCHDKKGGWWRNVTFSDATCNSPFAYFHLPAGMELFPFVIPEKRSGPLRIVPAKVTVTVEQVEEERSLPERHRDSPRVRCFRMAAISWLFVAICHSLGDRPP
ncbi:hypothetical protein QQF64_000237 [Cirrhinus molitorella]|uniref:Zinc-binding protein A33-like n=1 Tax=Cirrhinus molitorella TaxID=172907 RepID=A0ABR3NWY1_9TELE